MSQERCFALRGSILESERRDRIRCIPDGWLVCEEGKVAGAFPVLPARYEGIKVEDFSGRLIVPGMTDLHLHAPQYAFRGLGMDLELLDWLEQHAFPEEAKFAEMDYAARSYDLFTDALQKSATTRACIFATVHLPATLLLMERLEQSGLHTLVGKVNMDRNSPEILCEQDAAASLDDTRHWLSHSERFTRTKPILTPRFVPSCTDELMTGLGELQREFGLPVQSHLSENRSEIAWIKELSPESGCYGEAYDRFGLFGGAAKTVMAHCVYPDAAEFALMRTRNIFVAHCPQSNTNLASGIAPIRAYLDAGIACGLGSDVAGGFSLSMLRAMSDAVQVSKLRWRLVDETAQPLTVAEAFWMATRGGGAFFGKVGGFEPGWEFDAVVLDDRAHPTPLVLSPRERLERLVFLSDGHEVAAKYVAGHRIRL